MGKTARQSSLLSSNGTQKPQVAVVNFESGPVLWFEYPAFLEVSRGHITDPEHTKVPEPRTPKIPLTWTSQFDRLALDHVMFSAGLKKVAFDKMWLRNKNCSVVWGSHPKENSRFFFQLRQFQRFNHIPGSRNLTRKDTLIKTLKEFSSKSAMNVAKTEFRNLFHFVPKTFRIPEEKDQLKSFLKSNKKEPAFFISKPAASTKGSGIKIFSRKNVLDQLEMNRHGKQHIVIQEYIHNPYLLDKKKFDLRLYVLVTSYDPLRVYLFPEGIVRFCSDEYSLPKPTVKEIKSLSKESRAHITNVAKNKGAPRWKLSKLFETLNETHGDDAVEFLYERIKDLIVKTCIAGTTSARKDATQLGSRFKAKEQSCFELLGFDILIDEQLKPWLIEVNLSPSLATTPKSRKAENSQLSRKTSDTFLDVPVDAEEMQGNDMLKLKTMMLCDMMYLIGVPYTENFQANSQFDRLLAEEAGEQGGTRARGATFMDGISIVSKVSNMLQQEKEKNRRRKYTNRSMRSQKSLKSYRTEKSFIAADLREDERTMVEQGCEEFYRKGHFERIFPPLPTASKNNRKLYNDYLALFPSKDNYLNCLVRDYEGVVYSDLFSTTLLN